MIKILTQNGIENTNLDGARDGYFNSGGKDGISSGILNNGTLTAQGNVLTLDTCEMRIKGHRIVIDEPITKTISGFPTVDTNYQFIAKITYNDGSVTFDTEARPTTSLIQDDILNGNGTYEVVIGEFIHKTDGTIANLVPMMRVIFGGSGGVGAKDTGTGAEIFNSYEGDDANTASGNYSHAEGAGAKAGGEASHAEGGATTASGDESHSEGLRTTASGDYSHAEGSGTTASGLDSHAEGQDTQADGWHSHAEGIETKALGNTSHAEGAFSEVSINGDTAHAEGYGTKASSPKQHVQGKYNIEDTAGEYAHIVGNGTADTARSNAHTLDWQGNAWYAGKVSGGTEANPAPVVNANDYVTKKYFDDYKAADGKDGTTFTPSVSEDGIISWTNDGGKENPAPVNIKGPKGDSGVASGTVNSNTEGTSDTDGYTQQAVNKIASRPNLLINPDFSINQRGQASYTGAEYGVDRWRGYQLNTMICTPRSGYGVKLSAPTEATGTGAFYRQIFEDSQLSKLAGRTVTVSFKVSANEGTSRIYLRILANTVSAGDTPNIDSGVAGIVSKTVTLPSPLTSLEILFRKGTGTLSVDIDWVKFEIGSVATEFSHPSIAEELIKCQRYYQKVRLHGGTIAASTTKNMYPIIPLPITLRTKPTITVTTYPSIRGEGNNYQSTNSDSITVNSNESNGVVLAIVCSADHFTANKVYSLANGECSLDAEI